MEEKIIKALQDYVKQIKETPGIEEDRRHQLINGVLGSILVVKTCFENEK